MSNSAVIGILVCLAAFFLLEHYVLQWGAPLFLAKEFASLLHRLAFWR